MSTRSDIVPFILHNVWYFTITDSINDDIRKLSDTESWMDENDLELDTKLIIRNWEYQAGYPDFGKKKKLFGPCWIKNNFKIHLLNESEDESGWELLIAIVADDKESIAEFLKDFKDLITCKLSSIEELDTAQISQ